MAQPKKKSSFEQVVKLLGQLSPAELLELRRLLDSQELSWSSADFANASFERLQIQGILDANGRLISQTLPPDMQPSNGY